MEFKLPDIGEGVHEGEIVKWHVKEGDSVTENAPLVDVMTDKATVEISSPTSGKVARIHYKEGDRVEVDSIIVTFGTEVIQKEVKHAAQPTEVFPSKNIDPSASGTQDDKKQPSTPQVLAAPAARKRAQELGINLSLVKGSGPGGSVTVDDVEKQKSGSVSSKTAQTDLARFEPIAIPKIGPEERIAIKGIRKAIAKRLQMAKYYAPHFTHVEEADLTNLVKHRKKNKALAEKKKIKLTYLAYFVKALVASLKEFPYLNASLDETTQEIVLKKYFNIGVAVDTADGLVVPVLKNIDLLSLHDVAQEIERLAAATRENKARPEELKGSSFTVTSIGSIGGVFATPILNYPDVAILAINKIVERPVVIEGEVKIRHMIYLSLTLDHRVVDGAVAARFLNHYIEQLQKPEKL
ncbi:MAG: 2-oxo acid dehydrogenase subunit E2 [Deltaproteobacteria bacterium]|nr:2-oxo acid dehydrogenase subunit E2 [Deltaproteobacteria bacterium]